MAPPLDPGADGVVTHLASKTGWKPFGFDAELYKRDTAENSDFRKFDDGLKMTLDIDAEVADRIEQRLKQAERDRHRNLRAAPPDLGADDLPRRLAVPAQSRPLHRRRRRRLRRCGRQSQGQGAGLKKGADVSALLQPAVWEGLRHFPSIPTLAK